MTSKNSKTNRFNNEEEKFHDRKKVSRRKIPAEKKKIIYEAKFVETSKE